VVQVYLRKCREDDSCLIEYIEEVCADPEAWVVACQHHQGSFTLTKPKTALMSHSSRDPLEEQLDRSEDEPRKTYKNKSFIDAIWRRGPHDSDDSRSSTDVDDSMKITDSQASRHSEACTACCKNTDFSDTVAVLMSRSRKYERLHINPRWTLVV
jgi:hypothetical protein